MTRAQAGIVVPMNESDLMLDAAVRERLEQALGIEVPDPNSLEFQSLLEELQENQPELFEEVMRGLTVNVEFPAEEQANKAARRESFYALVTRLIFRRSAVDGKPVAAKRRWLMYAFFAMALIGPGFYIFGQSFGRKEVTEEPEKLAQVQPVEPFQPSIPLDQDITPEPKQPTPEPKQPTPEPKQPAPPPMPVQKKEPAPKPKITPPSPRPVAPPTPAPTPTPTPVQPREVAVARPNSLTLYKNETPPPTAMKLYEDTSAEGEAKVGLTIFKEETPSEALLIAQDEDIASDTLLIAQNEDTTTVPLTLPFKENAEQQEDQSTEGDIESDGTQEGDEAITEVASGEGLSGELTPGKRLEDILDIGARIGAVLETGIIVTQGTSTPVVAKSGSDWCTAGDCPEITWIGQATLDASSRIQITFTQAIFDDATQTIKGMALGEKNTPGLKASIKDTAPTVAQDLLRSAAGGFSDYVDALSKEQTVSYIDGIAVSETETPPLDSFIVGEMASIFDLPEDTTPIIRIAEITAQSQLVVLFGLSPTDAASLQE
jgi:hypothetical protein